MIQRYIFTLIKLIIFILWPLTVSAAVVAGAIDPFVGITTIHVLVMLIISTLSGLTALTIRMDSELKKFKNAKLPRPRLFVSSHMLGSWLAGVLSVSIAQQNNFGIWAQISIVIAASFSGAKFVEKVSEMYIGKIIKETPELKKEEENE